MLSEYLHSQQVSKSSGIGFGPVLLSCHAHSSSTAWSLTAIPALDTFFLVKISEVDNVRDLKEAVKERKHTAFQHIHADALEHWNVSIPVETLLEAHLHNF